MSEESYSEIRITDASGKILETYSNLSEGMELHFGTDYVPGVYFVNASNGMGNRGVLRVVKRD